MNDCHNTQRVKNIKMKRDLGNKIDKRQYATVDNDDARLAKNIFSKKIICMRHGNENFHIFVKLVASD